MGGYVKLKDNTDEQFHEYLPDDKHQEPVRTYSDAHPDKAWIMDRFNAKDNSSDEQMDDLLVNPSKFKSRKGVLKEIFMECILIRSKKNLDEMKRLIEEYAGILFKFYRKSDESQVKAINTITRCWTNNSYWAGFIIENLYKLGLFNARGLLTWAF